MLEADGKTVAVELVELKVTTEPPKGEDLKSKGRRWQRAMRSADTGPLIVAQEVLEVVHDWPRYQEEAEGLSANAWLRKTFGGEKTTAYWEHRARAVGLLGEAIRRTIHHEVAVWLSRLGIPTEQRVEVRDMLINECRKNGGNPLSVAMAKPRVREILGANYSRRVRVCQRCKMLEGLLQQHGIDVPEE